MLKLIVAAALVSIAPGVASAQDVVGQARVSYRDLDLRKPEGVKRFDRRISNAITSLCSETNNIPLDRKIAFNRCFKDVQASVAEQRARALFNAGNTEVAAR
jgi:UrcA family protein